jgi:metal transporter CNNM
VTTGIVWLGILLCLSQSALFSGLNLAFFTLSKLQLELEVAKGNPEARRVLALREDSNFLLVTILWGNVAVNVLLALLSGSVLAGVLAFLFSTVVITIFGEIIPQAYFSRNALPVASRLAPVLRMYQILLYPIAKPTALVLDRWLGPEAIRYYKERDLRELIRIHMASRRTEIEQVEGQGALNFLAIDDVPLSDEGETIDPDSIIQLDFSHGRPAFPELRAEASDPFLQRIHRSRRKWIVLVDARREPRLVLDSDEFIRDLLFHTAQFNPYRHCHRPVIVRDDRTRIGEIIPALKPNMQGLEGDDVIDHDVILLWGAEKRVVTGGDVLGRLLRGIAGTPAATLNGAEIN